MNTEKPTLVYFHTVGRAEVPRLILELAGVDYHYHSISHPLNKGFGEPWEEYKAKHADELTFGQIPQYKEPGGINIVQSHSIIRYLARKHGFNGANEQEAVAIDVLSEGVFDFMMGYAKAKFYTEESKRDAEVQKFLTEAFPKHVAHFQRALEHNHGGNGFFVGDKVSYADLFFFVIVKILHDSDKDILTKLPASLAGLYNRVNDLPSIKKYYASEPYKTQ